MEGVAPPEALMEGVGGEDVPGLQEPKLDKYGVARCGHCRTCLKPHLKKACLTNKKKRKLQGFEPQTNFTKVKGEKRLKITGLKGVGTIVIRQPVEANPKAKQEQGVEAGDADNGGRAEGAVKRKKKWRKEWVLVPNLLQNGYCKLLKWVDDSYDESFILSLIEQKSTKIEFIPSPSAAAQAKGPQSPSPAVQRDKVGGSPNRVESPNEASPSGGGGAKCLAIPGQDLRAPSPKPSTPKLGNKRLGKDWKAMGLKQVVPGAFMCSHPGCGKVFSESSSLRKHMQTHGEKQFLCTYPGCGKRFVDSSKLKRHYLIHTGERRFKCPFAGCGKAFSLDFNLRSHIRSMHKEEVLANPEILKMRLKPTEPSTATAAVPAPGGSPSNKKE